MSNRHAGPEDGLFYVGYLPVPKKLRTTMIALAAGLLCCVAGLAALTASQMRDPGTGVWEDTATVTLTGTLTSEPYPMLFIKDESTPGGTKGVLLVQTGKFGAQPLVTGPQQHASISGFLVHRNGKTLLEVSPSTTITSASDDNKSHDGLNTESTPLGRFTLRGTIIDPKCYLGVMKPGDGKAHKACATLCISGGIPPVFLTKDEHDNPTYYLLTDTAGHAVNQTVLPYIAEPIELRGDVERRGDWLIFKADMATITRL